MKQLFMNLSLFFIAWVLHKTYRYRYYDFQNRLKGHAHHPKGAAILALWHGDSFIGTLAHGFQKYAPLCSYSPDGQMVAFLCRRMGLTPVDGSSSKGGKEARNVFETTIAAGISPAITVDGPKGPRHVAKNGAIAVAKKTGAAITPVLAKGDRYWQLGSWDRLKIPKPFARIAICYAPPIIVANDADGEAFEAYRQQLDTTLLQLDEDVNEKLASWTNDSSVVSFRQVTAGN